MPKESWSWLSSKTIAVQAMAPLESSRREAAFLSRTVPAKNGASYVALIDARRLDYYHALESEHANLVLADDAITGLRQALAGQFVPDEELDQALGVAPAL